MKDEGDKPPSSLTYNPFTFRNHPLVGRAQRNNVLATSVASVETFEKKTGATQIRGIRKRGDRKETLETWATIRRVSKISTKIVHNNLMMLVKQKGNGVDRSIQLRGNLIQIFRRVKRY